MSGLKDKEQGDRLEAFINKGFDNYAKSQGLKKHRLRIEFEAFATRAIMVAKKRYAMKLSDGRYKIAGFQLKRSDAQIITKEVQETILHQILSGANKKETREYYHRIKDEILSGEHQYEIGIPHKFTKRLDKYADSSAIRGAYFSNEHLGTHIGAGDKCLIYHIKQIRAGLPTTTTLALEDDMEIPEGYTIDIRKHWERMEKALLPLLNDLDILEKSKQVNLSDFI